MRKLLLLLPMALLLAACNLSSVPYLPGPSGQSVHHKRTAEQAIVTVQVDPSASVQLPYLRQSIADWSKSKYVDLREGTCSPFQSCVLVRGRVMNGGSAGICTGCRHFTDYTPSNGWVYVWLDNSPNQHPANMQNMDCHELGHALGLDHGNVQGPCQNGKPTAWDLAVVDALHDHKEA